MPILADLNFKTVVGLALLYLVGQTLTISLYRLFFHPLRKFPGPPLYAISFLPFLYNNYLKGRFYRGTLDLHKKYGPVVRTGPNHLAVDGFAAWPQIHNHRGGDHEEWLKVPDWLFQLQEYTLIGASTEDHRRMRRLIGFAFTDTELKRQEATIHKYVNSLMNRFSEHAARGKSLNIGAYFNFFAFDTISDLTFSNCLGSLEKEEFHPWVKSVLEGGPGVGAYRCCKGLNSIFPIYFFIQLFGMGSSIAATNSDGALAVTMTEERLAKSSDEKADMRDFVGYMEKKGESKGSMTPFEIMLNCPTIIFAGSETTASVLTAGMFYLDGYPQVRDMLKEEVRSSFASEEDINLRSVNKLPYLAAVLDETMRLYPPGAEITPRMSPGAMIDGHWVPKGTTCSIHVYSSNHNPKYFNDPELCQPQRWLPKDHALYETRFENEDQDVCKSFGYGPRNCVGKNLAMFEMKMVLARLMWRFDVTVLPGQKDWLDQMNYMMWEKKPLRVTFEERSDA